MAMKATSRGSAGPVFHVITVLGESVAQCIQSYKSELGRSRTLLIANRSAQIRVCINDEYGFREHTSLDQDHRDNMRVKT